MQDRQFNVFLVLIMSMSSLRGFAAIFVIVTAHIGVSSGPVENVWKPSNRVMDSSLG